MKHLSILFAVALIFTVLPSCKKKGCMDPTAENYNAAAEKDDGSCTYATEATVTLKFSQNINGSSISAADFDQLNYTTPEGNTYSVTKMQYLISDVRLYKANGDSVMVDGYHLVDMSDTTTLTYELPEVVRIAPYVGIGFTFGFDAEDNISGQYADLNALSWSSPEELGGGYHQMKFEGRYIDDITDTIGFQYHSLSKIRKTTPDTTFHDNYVNVNLTKSLDITGNTTVEIKMDIQEWFENPNLWDLDVYYAALMSDYNAQIMMRQNAATVFSVGTVTIE